ncbi:ATP-dependent DNA helicase II subunit 1 [Lepidopterella palustris CBS 459.81]|uniref:ATP-dependent DNA helicase II subunit 1 n=1 Tax=Lepidopterella palustris CBS 459.81 TaxID=1314670 RepID=A0A8E2EBS5_9PEZI|nr:ATP-dependent DNA helicase II subunit 1 [Lepidopterella palustris CBS 459.81]
MADLSENNKPDSDEDEDEEIDDTGYKTVKDAVLFAIGVSDSMLKRPPPSEDKKADRDSPTSAALKCAYQLMQQRIISNPNDMMGILLFGTEDTSFDEVNAGDLSFPHCYLLADLDVPAASDVKRLRDLVENEDEADMLLAPSKEGVNMANLLFCANQIFTTKAPNFSSRRLFLVTDDDNPVGDDKSAKDNAVTRAKDLYDLGVTIELFPISKPGHGFTRTKFYDDIIYRASPLDLDAPAQISSAAKTASSGDGITLLQSLLSSVNSKAAPRRALFNLPLEIGPGLTIGIKGYIMIKRQTAVKSCYVWVGGEKAQIAISTTTQMVDDTARAVEKTEVRKAYKFGGEAVYFTPEEMKQIRECFGEPVIRIIGFKPLSMLPIWANTRHPTFIYPSETDYIGSTRVFSALQQKLLKDKKMGIAWFIPRKNANPVIAAIVPGAERLGPGDEQIMPPGLWVIPLPFADDIRQNPETKLMKTTGELTDMMRMVIQQLQLPKASYDPARYPNPSLQWFYRILQAIALDEDLPEKPEDKTIPRYKQIDKRAGDYVIKWGKALESEYQQRIKLSKRPADSSASSAHATPLPKRIKMEAGAGAGTGMTDEQMAEANDRGNVSKLSVGVLREWLGVRKLSTMGKKLDLVSRVQQYFE